MKNPWNECVESLAQSKEHFAECDKPKVKEIADRIKNKVSGNGEIRLNLPPQPFEGNVEKSKIVVLALNPGWQEGDDEQQSKEPFIDETSKCMLQTSDGKFFSLMPEFKEHNHYNWWNERLLVEKDEGIHKLFGSVEKYREFLIENLSAVQFFPYHSKEDKGIKCDYARLNSQKYSFELVRKAIADNKTIIILRSVSDWKKAVPELEGYPYYECINKRSTYISDNNLKNAEGKKVSLSEILEKFVI